MPNHVSTILTLCPSVAKESLIRKLTDEERAAEMKNNSKTAANFKARTGQDWPHNFDDLNRWVVDFEILIPQPENIEKGGCNGTHEDGVICWYSWSIENWGTKWNAYDASVEAVEGDLIKIEFDTAWSHPAPIIEPLGAKHPEETILVEWADEDLGHNVGRYRVVNNEVLDFEELSGTPEGLDLACQIKCGISAEEYLKEREQDDIESARRYLHARRIEQERGLTEGGYRIIHEEGLETPADIVAAIQTHEQAEAVYE